MACPHSILILNSFDWNFQFVCFVKIQSNNPEIGTATDDDDGDYVSVNATALNWLRSNWLEWILSGKGAGKGLIKSCKL